MRGPTSSGLNQGLASPSILRLFVGTDHSQVLRPLTVTSDATLAFPFSIPTRTSPVDSPHHPVSSMRELTDSCSPCAAAPHPLQCRQLIHPYVQLDIKYFDLGLDHRDAVRRYSPIYLFPY